MKLPTEAYDTLIMHYPLSVVLQMAAAACDVPNCYAASVTGALVEADAPTNAPPVETPAMSPSEQVTAQRHGVTGQRQGVTR